MPGVGNESNHVFDGVTVRGGLGLVGDVGLTTYLNRDNAAQTARASLLQRKQGYFAETVQRGVVGTATIMITGSVYFCPVGLLAGDVVTNILSMCTVLGSGFSGNGVKFGLYSSAGVLLASSIDVNASFASAGAKTVAMQTPYTVPVDDVYYLAGMAIASTCPTLARGASLIGGTAFTGATIPMCGVFVSQTDLPAQATVTANFLGINYWMGAS